jgi:hypothetical protein
MRYDWIDPDTGFDQQEPRQMQALKQYKMKPAFLAPA